MPQQPRLRMARSRSAHLQTKYWRPLPWPGALFVFAIFRAIGWQRLNRNRLCPFLATATASRGGRALQSWKGFLP